MVTQSVKTGELARRLDTVSRLTPRHYAEVGQVRMSENMSTGFPDYTPLVSRCVDPARLGAVRVCNESNGPRHAGRREKLREFKRACRRRISGDTPSYIHRGSRGSVICSEYAERLCRYRIEW